MKRVLFIILAVLAVSCGNKEMIKVAIITGENDKSYDPNVLQTHLLALLEENPTFVTDTIRYTSKEEFAPKFTDYNVIILNLNPNSPWSDATKLSFEKYMADGGGLVIIHENNNNFPEWKEFNRMIGLGAWEGRTEKDGPYLYYKDGEFVRDYTSGDAGKHGSREPFTIYVRNSEHPIMRGLPLEWLHEYDELYGDMRGPAENITPLTTAFSDAETGGTGKEELVMFTIDYGKGRVFQSTLGHTTTTFDDSHKNRGFHVTLLRGIEWAATGDVKQTVTF